VERVLNASTHYEVLRIPMSASSREIKEGFNATVRMLHEDRNTDPRSNDAFIKATEARKVLADPKRRAAYDAILSFERDKAKRFVSDAGPPPETAADGSTSNAKRKRQDEEKRSPSSATTDANAKRKRASDEAQEGGVGEPTGRRGKHEAEKEEDEEDEEEGGGGFRTPIYPPPPTGDESIAGAAKRHVLEILNSKRRDAASHFWTLERNDPHLASAVAMELNRIRARVSTACVTISTAEDLAFVWHLAQELNIPDLDLGRGREALCLKVGRALSNATVASAGGSSGAEPLVWGVFKARDLATHGLLRLRRMRDIGDALANVASPSCNFDGYVLPLPELAPTPAPGMRTVVAALRDDPTSLGPFEVAQTLSAQTSDRIARIEAVGGLCARLVRGMYAPNFLLSTATCVSPGHGGRIVTLACEHAEGGTLADLLAEPRVTDAFQVSAVVQTAMALVAAATAGLVHGDLRPEIVPCQRVTVGFWIRYSAFGRRWRLPLGRMVMLPFVLSSSSTSSARSSPQIPNFARDLWDVFTGMQRLIERAPGMQAKPVAKSLRAAVRVLEREVSAAVGGAPGAVGDAASLVEVMLRDSGFAWLVDSLASEGVGPMLRTYHPQRGGSVEG
jgi:curved DNA-binding protein CbpA